MKKYTLILDTETVSKKAYFSIYDHYVFDFGFCIVDNETKEIVYEYDVFIKEIWEDEDYMKHFFFSDNYLDWYKDNLNKPIVSMEAARFSFYLAVEQYAIEDIAIYNATFDINSLRTTSAAFCKEVIDLYDFHIIDIYHMACQALRDEEAYKIFCETNGFLTDKGNIQSNVEAVYSYITNSSFKEAHTALEDAKVEKEIYFCVFDREKTEGYEYIRTPNTNCWRLVQRKK